MKPDILLVEDTITELPIVAALESDFTVHLLPEKGDREAVLAEVAGRIRGMSTTPLAGADARLINALPHLEIIAIAGNHTDRIDLDAARARNIPVTNTPPVTTEDVADLVAALLLSVARGVAAADRFVRAGRWPLGFMPLGTQVSGKKVGIVGLGRIGRESARRLEGFRMDISYHQRQPLTGADYPYFADLVEMARAVDFLVVTCITAPSTHHMINAPVLKALGPHGFLVNIARGVIDETALLRALRDRDIAGVACDVFENEPTVPEELFAFDNVVLTPHIGAGTTAVRQVMADTAAANLRAHFAGKPLLMPVP